MIGGKFYFIGDTNQQREKNAGEKLFYFFHFWVFEVRRFRNPTNKISVALHVCNVTYNGTWTNKLNHLSSLCGELTLLLKQRQGKHQLLKGDFKS
jgi:hypothetical protein